MTSGQLYYAQLMDETIVLIFFPCVCHNDVFFTFGAVGLVEAVRSAKPSVEVSLNACVCCYTCVFAGQHLS